MHNGQPHTVIGLDIGYGYTKGVTQHRHVLFPSLLGPAVDVKYRNDLASESRGVTVAFQGTTRFLGELAALQSPFTISPRTRERDPALLQVLTLGACHLLGITNRRVHMVTGLPVQWYADRARLEETLAGTYHVTVNGEPSHLEIKAVKVVPQPFGSLFRALLNARGVFVDRDHLAQDRVAVLDIGTHTTDFAYADQLRYVEPKSGSIPVAMARVYELLTRKLADSYGLELSLTEVEQAAHAGRVTCYGEQHTIQPLYKESLHAVGEEIVAHATTLWDDGKGLAAVLLTGGGAEALAPMIQRTFPHTRVMSQPQLANAQGFYRYGLRTFRS